MSLSTAKLPQWLRIAKDVMKDNPNAVVCLNDEDLFHYINDQVPITNKLSFDYVRKLLMKDYFENSDASIDLKLTAEELRKVWRSAKIKAQLEIFNQMMSEDSKKSWQREKFILERRFKDGWAEQKDIKIDEEQTVNINFVKDGE